MTAPANSEPDRPLDFTGRVVVITGGTVGMGAALAFLIARQGGTAWVCGRNLDAVREISAAAADRQLAVHARQADATSDEEVGRLVAEAAETSGGIHGLVCAAGSGIMGTVEEIGPEDWEKSVSEKLRGVYLPVRHVVPHMKRAGGGSIVTVSSVHAHTTTERRDAIAPTTAAMVAFMRALAVSHGRHGIRANSVSPGPFESATWRGNWQRMFPRLEFAEIADRVGKSIPLQRIGQPAEIAEPVAFLLSDHARYISGTDLRIDGGLGAKLAMNTSKD
ncbi:SDR family NAD(P)-dependent oxidoreductase [Chelativorans sp. AA-79]|uniref:SDR family NAD(P)-dependent oxidoreductase n=1 Tax=Chelativorans sp. AA-79 TaxID=3028735 RepID=UPI0023F666DB|nr:SDR family NAD(P)-dependent oxidoreductase [Chelativorans sp. AA-79]WEX12431.1 SDR family NAD(P)-dependent oxidoreductase [Chelativorans sp. AA-79]